MFWREDIKANQTINPASSKIPKYTRCLVGNHRMYRKEEGMVRAFNTWNSGEVT